MDNRIIGVIAVLAVIIIIILAVTGTLPNGQVNDDTNITLIKADTEGHVSEYDNGKMHYCYYLKGVLKNLPDNMNGYDIKTRFYGEDGKYLDDDGDVSDITRSSANSQVTTLGFVNPSEDYHMEKVEITVINPDGVVVFNDTVKFDMNKFDYSDLNGESSDDSNSAHYSVEGQVDGKSYSYDVDLNTN